MHPSNPCGPLDRGYSPKFSKAPGSGAPRRKLMTVTMNRKTIQEHLDFMLMTLDTIEKNCPAIKNHQLREWTPLSPSIDPNETITVNVKYYEQSIDGMKEFLDLIKKNCCGGNSQSPSRTQSEVSASLVHGGMHPSPTTAVSPHPGDIIEINRKTMQEILDRMLLRLDYIQENCPKAMVSSLIKSVPKAPWVDPNEFITISIERYHEQLRRMRRLLRRIKRSCGGRKHKKNKKNNNNNTKLG